MFEIETKDLKINKYQLKLQIKFIKTYNVGFSQHFKTIIFTIKENFNIIKGLHYQ